MDRRVFTTHRLEFRNVEFFHHPIRDRRNPVKGLNMVPFD